MDLRPKKKSSLNIVLHEYAYNLSFALKRLHIVTGYELYTVDFVQVLGLVRPPGFNRLPAPGEEVILSYIPFTHVASQTIDIYYSITIAGTLCFVDDGRDLVTVSFEVSKTSLESKFHVLTVI